MVSRAAVPRELFHTADEAPRYVFEGALYFGLIHAHLGLALAGLVPAWTMAVLLPIWMVRTMIGRHELIHLRSALHVDAFTRRWPVLAMLTPLSAGYREYRDNHQLHHKYLLTERDPDLYQMRGSKLAGFLNVLTAPEQDLVRWVAAHGVDRDLVANVLMRGTFFVAVAAVSGPLFLWYWVPLRLTYAAALFIFTYGLHRRGDAEGTFAIPLGPVAIAAFVALFGRTAWQAVCNHDVHHADTRIAADRLDEARARMESAGDEAEEPVMAAPVAAGSSVMPPPSEARQPSERAA